MDRQPNDLETAITSLTGSFAKQLDALATADYVREGILKEAVTSLIWDLYHQMPDQRRALSESLENWPGIIADAIAADRTDNIAQ